MNRQRGPMGRVRGTARLKVLLGHFDVQALIRVDGALVPSLSWSDSLLEDHGFLRLGHCLRLTRPFLTCRSLLGRLARAWAFLEPTCAPQRPQGCGQTHPKGTTGLGSRAVRGALSGCCSSHLLRHADVVPTTVVVPPFLAGEGDHHG